MAEALALRLGMEKVRELEISDLIIEGDSKIITDFLNSHIGCPWEIEMVM